MQKNKIKNKDDFGRSPSSMDFISGFYNLHMHCYLYKEVIGLGDEWLNYQASVSDMLFFILEQKHCIKEYRWSIARLSAINSLMRLITPTPACPFN